MNIIINNILTFLKKSKLTNNLDVTTKALQGLLMSDDLDAVKKELVLSVNIDLVYLQLNKDVMETITEKLKKTNSFYDIEDIFTNDIQSYYENASNN